MVFIFLKKDWNDCVNKYGLPVMISALNNEEVSTLVGGSCATVYHVAGWLLFRMRKNLPVQTQGYHYEVCGSQHGNG
jgi:hypothetical protein